MSVLLVYVTGDECHVASKTFIYFFFSLQSLIQTINVGDCLSTTTTITKTKERREHPNDTPRPGYLSSKL